MQKFRQLFSYKTFQLLIILVLLTSILAVSTILKPDVFREVFSRVSLFASDMMSGRLWKEKSQAQVYLEDGSLKINFQISPDDQSALKIFNQSLGVSTDYLQGLVLKIDEGSQQKLQSFLPMQLTMQIENDRIVFQSGIVPGFASSLVTETTEFATGSSKLRLSQYSSNAFALDVTDPEPLLQYATASGQFVLSDKLQPLYSILEQVSTIKMSINGKSVSGEVKLK